jgi:hypothetical protein
MGLKRSGMKNVSLSIFCGARDAQHPDDGQTQSAANRLSFARGDAVNLD